MRKKKNTEELEVAVDATPVEQPVEIKEEVQAEQPSENTEVVDEQPVEISDTIEAQPFEEVPEFAQKLLSIYPNYPALYIDNKGGVYPEDAKPNEGSDAILYQNPYYKQ